MVALKEAAVTITSQDAALGILDWLYVNQVLVWCVWSQQERTALQDLHARLDAQVLAAVGDAPGAVYVKHLLLCLAEVMSFEVPPAFYKDAPPGLDPQVLKRSVEYRSNYLQAMLLVMAEKSGRDLGGLSDVQLVAMAGELSQQVRQLPAALRRRLVERSLTLSFPDAPLNLLQWLVRLGIVQQDRFDARRISLAPQHSEVCDRIGLLCEFEALRRTALRGPRDRNETLMFLAEADKNLRLGAHAWRELARAMVLEPVHTELKSYPLFLVERAHDPSYLESFLETCAVRINRPRQASRTPAQWVGALAAAKLEIEHQRSGEPLFGRDVVTGVESGLRVAVGQAMTAAGFPMKQQQLRTHWRRFRDTTLAWVQDYDRSCRQAIWSGRGEAGVDQDDVAYRRCISRIGAMPRR